MVCQFVGSPATALLPQNGRLSRLFLRLRPRLAQARYNEVDTRDHAPLSRRAVARTSIHLGFTICRRIPRPEGSETPQNVPKVIKSRNKSTRRPFEKHLERFRRTNPVKNTCWFALRNAQLVRLKNDLLDEDRLYDFVPTEEAQKVSYSRIVWLSISYAIVLRQSKRRLSIMRICSSPMSTLSPTSNAAPSKAKAWTQCSKKRCARRFTTVSSSSNRLNETSVEFGGFLLFRSHHAEGLSFFTASVLRAIFGANRCCCALTGHRAASRGTSPHAFGRIAGVWD